MWIQSRHFHAKTGTSARQVTAAVCVVELPVNQNGRRRPDTRLSPPAFDDRLWRALMPTERTALGSFTGSRFDAELWAIRLPPSGGPRGRTSSASSLPAEALPAKLPLSREISPT